MFTMVLEDVVWIAGTIILLFFSSWYSPSYILIFFNEKRITLECAALKHTQNLIPVYPVLGQYYSTKCIN